MNSVEEQIEHIIRRWHRGRIFFAQDFTDLGSPENVRQTLCSLTEKGTIIRLARGVYYWPKLEGEFAVKIIYPSDDTIAYAIAKRDKVRIIPYGDKAAAELGLTGIIISNSTYLTDGPPRHISISNKHKIHFNHTSEVKIFAYSDETMQKICSAIRAVGLDNIRDREKRIIKEALKKVPRENYMKDLQLPPAWVSSILLELRAE